MQIVYTLTSGIFPSTYVYLPLVAYKSVKKSGNPSNTIGYIVDHVAYVAHSTGRSPYRTSLS